MVVEDNRLAAALLGDVLEGAGYSVVKADSGLEALGFAQQGDIDLILLDIMMPDMDGYEVVRQLRNDTRTYNTPVILLSSYQDTAEKIKGFELGADDYITKPFVPAELLARVMAHLRRLRLALASSPLTGLPGNASVEDELIARAASREPFAVIYVDLDNFKAFNDVFGFVQGDEMIKLLADVLQFVVKQTGNPHDLVGHIGGDDFVVVTTPSNADIICQQTISRFDVLSKQLYEEGSEELLPATLSIALVTSEFEQYTDHRQIAQVAAELKRQAKAMSGSIYVESSSPRQDTGKKSILVIDDDRLVSAVLQANFEQEGYDIILVSSVLAAVHVLRNQLPDLVVLDVVLPGASGLAFCRRLRSNLATADIPILMVSSSAQSEQALEAGADAFLAKPFNITILFETIEQMLQE